MAEQKNNKQRRVNITDLYLGGVPVAAVAIKYKVSRERIYQILRQEDAFTQRKLIIERHLTKLKP